MCLSHTYCNWIDADLPLQASRPLPGTQNPADAQDAAARPAEAASDVRILLICHLMPFAHLHSHAHPFGLIMCLTHTYFNWTDADLPLQASRTARSALRQAWLRSSQWATKRLMEIDDTSDSLFASLAVVFNANVDLVRAGVMAYAHLHATGKCRALVVFSK